jgi:two-component system cell cycle sensor histidine kinase/response regulator CckA
VDPIAPAPTILVVEDAAVVRSLVEESLAQCGYTVLEARDAEEALSVSKSHDGSIEVLLTDLLMPEISGHELARRIREHRPAIKVIYMSGYSTDTMATGDKDATFLEKPFRPEQLATLVRKVLDS